MATEVRWRRGSSAEHETFTGAESEITVNTDDYSLHTHDGVTPGGMKSLTENNIGSEAEHESPEGVEKLARLDRFAEHFPFFPSGGIIMWSGSIDSIPSGWALCDGDNGTPDLRDRFVIGAGGDRSVDETSDGQMPEHTHTGPDHNHSVSLDTNSNGGHTHNIWTWTHGDTNHEHSDRNEPSGDPEDETKGTNTSSVRYAGDHSHSVSGDTGNAGTGNTGSAGSGSEVIAKYYALAYIMKL